MFYLTFPDVLRLFNPRNAKINDRGRRSGNCNVIARVPMSLHSKRRRSYFDLKEDGKLISAHTWRENVAAFRGRHVFKTR